MHKLQLEFNTITNYQAIDALVFALSIELFVQLRIECTQPEYDILEFESARHCMLAQLTLCGNSRYTIKVL
jgi:hypothetical protein